MTKVHAISTKLRSQVKLPDRESAALANFTGDLRCIATFELWYYIRYRATFVEHRRNYDVKKSPDRGVTTNYPVDHAGSRYQRISTSPSRDSDKFQGYINDFRGSWDHGWLRVYRQIKDPRDRVINCNPIEFLLFSRLQVNSRDSQVFQRVTVLEIATIACRCYPTMSICNSKGKWSRNDCVIFIKKERREFILLKNSFRWLNRRI